MSSNVGFGPCRSLPPDDDRTEYLRRLSVFGARYGLQREAWCLMTNHVHLVAVPAQPDSLARAIGEAHRRYTRLVHVRAGVRGHVFQERFQRFHSFPIQTERHVIAVVRYVECNPVRAKMVRRAVEYPWSSARHHVTGTPDRLVTDSPIRQMIPAWGPFVQQAAEAELTTIRRPVGTGRPWGTERRLHALEQQVGRTLRPRQGGWPKGRSRKASR